jgi:hypothetical protein
MRQLNHLKQQHPDCLAATEIPVAITCWNKYVTLDEVGTLV